MLQASSPDLAQQPGGLSRFYSLTEQARIPTNDVMNGHARTSPVCLLANLAKLGYPSRCSSGTPAAMGQDRLIGPDPMHSELLSIAGMQHATGNRQQANKYTVPARERHLNVTAQHMQD